MIDALLARPLSIEFRGEPVRLRRPTVADLVAAIDAQSRGENMTAWYIAAHVLAADGSLAYSVDQAKQLHAPTAIALVRDHIEPLYAEGLD
jgi:hypothetical protein